MVKVPMFYDRLYRVDMIGYMIGCRQRYVKTDSNVVEIDNS